MAHRFLPNRVFWRASYRAAEPWPHGPLRSIWTVRLGGRSRSRLREHCRPTFSGPLRPGDRLPGSRTLAGMLKVHRQTVVTAIDDLVAEGWLVCKKASGTFVADGLPEAPTNRRRDTERSRRASPSRFALELASAPLPELPRDAGAGALLMSGTRPDVRLLPAELIGRYYRRSIGAFGAHCSRAQSSGRVGSPSPATRAHALAHAGPGHRPASIMVTRGSQMALTLLAHALIRPGDAVAVEHPGYRPAWEAFRLAGAEVLPVHVDDRGLDVRALRQLIARRRIRAVYVTPHHQFPTTVTLSGPRRLELLDLAAHERFAVIEDDYDHEFHYSGKPVLPMASIDRAGVVAYVGAVEGAGAGPQDRIRCRTVGPDRAAHRLPLLRRSAGRSRPRVCDRQMLEDGLIQRHVRKMRRAYRARLGTLAAALRQQLGDFLTFREPSGVPRFGCARARLE